MNTLKIISLLFSTIFIYLIMYSKVPFLIRLLITVSLVVAMRSFILQ